MDESNNYGSVQTEHSKLTKYTFNKKKNLAEYF